AEAALRVVDAANEGDKPNAELHALRAIILLRTNDNAAAIREAQRAYEIDPANVDAISLLASKKVVDGDLDGALKLLDSVPAASKGADAGRAELEARIKAGGDDFDYQIALAELNLGQNRADAAVQALQKLANTAATPDKKLAAQVKLAEVYITKNDRAAAEPL